MNKITRRDFVRSSSTAAALAALTASKAIAAVGQTATRVDPMAASQPRVTARAPVRPEDVFSP